MLDISTGTNIHQKQHYERAIGCFYTILQGVIFFFSLNTQTFSILFSFLTLEFLARMSQYASNPSLLSCQRMMNKEGELLGDDGKRQHPLTSALTPLWRQPGKKNIAKNSSLSN